MVATCCVVGCFNRHGTGSEISFFRFPAVDSDRRSQWIAAVKRRTASGKPWEPSKHDRVCSDHFVQGKPSMDPCDADYAPSVRLGYSSKQRTDNSRLERRAAFNESRAKSMEAARRAKEEEAERFRRCCASVRHDHGGYSEDASGRPSDGEAASVEATEVDEVGDEDTSTEFEVGCLPSSNFQCSHGVDLLL